MEHRTDVTSDEITDTRLAVHDLQDRVLAAGGRAIAAREVRHLYDGGDAGLRSLSLGVPYLRQDRRTGRPGRPGRVDLVIVARVAPTGTVGRLLGKGLAFLQIGAVAAIGLTALVVLAFGVPSRSAGGRSPACSP